MRSRLLALVLAAAACGGSPKSTTPLIPLPDDKPPVAETKPEEKPPEEAPKQQGPVDIPIPTRTLEVKVVNGGKGKKAKLAFTPKAGEKSKIELALDFDGVQDAPEDLGGKVADVSPTALLTADVETTEVTASGQAKFSMTFSAVDVKARDGSKADPVRFKASLESLLGATISGTVDPDGQLKDAKIHIEKPDQRTVGGLQFLALSMMPMWPVLPADAIAPGAKWTVSSPEQVASQVDITKVVTYELVGKKGTVWTLKGSTAITGKDQKIENDVPKPDGTTAKSTTTIGKIGGSGKHEVTLTDGALMPTMKQSNTTNFSASGDVPAEGGKPARTVEIKFTINQSNAITPKT